MGRTLPSASILLMQFKDDVTPFKRGLARRDQTALDDLFAFAGKHVAEAAYAADAIPSTIFMTAMLLELHREVMALRGKIEK